MFSVDYLINKTITNKYSKKRLERKIRLISIAGKTIFDNTEYSESLKENPNNPIINSEWNTKNDNAITLGNFNVNVFPKPDNEKQFYPNPDQASTIPEIELDEEIEDINDDLTSNITGEKSKYRNTMITDFNEPYSKNKYYGIQDSNHLNRDWFLDQSNKA